MYKIIAKIMANRLKQVMNEIISTTQSAFLADNILISHELLHYMKRPQGMKHFLTLKLDMSKAYDKVEWPYLLKIMEKKKDSIVSREPRPTIVSLRFPSKSY